MTRSSVTHLHCIIPYSRDLTVRNQKKQIRRLWCSLCFFQCLLFMSSVLFSDVVGHFLCESYFL
ncbi:hypothetical protein Micbo1qcDRAFT_55031 [Microdochium bolleyi]|uniref:Uncharacterized protein n=1 Tax=Microdochium bolleyi TaxID=196109 RepID=A0A136J8C1_9PEZI|nr:hypothetical protein Micbo1qcDRAFT_55031 [Microdochium bolleyi]